jgi:hypothetical protein
MLPVNDCLHVEHLDQPSLMMHRFASAACTLQAACASPASERHAHPLWIGGGSDSRHMMHAPASLSDDRMTGRLVFGFRGPKKGGHLRKETVSIGPTVPMK